MFTLLAVRGCRRSTWLLLFLATIVPGVTARGDEYADMAAVITKPLFASRLEAKAGSADEAIMLRLEIARRALRETDTSTLPASQKATHSRALAKLDAARASLDTIRRLDATTTDFGGVVDKALQASPALIRNYEQQSPLAGDQAAVNMLIAKGVTEVVKAGVNQLQLAQEREAYRAHYGELGRIALELPSYAKERPCLYGLGMRYDFTDDGPRSGVVVSRCVPGGPADKAGIRSGDRFVAINGVPIVEGAGLNESSLAGLNPAAAGTTVAIRVTRGAESLDFTVKRSLPLNDLSTLVSLRLHGSCDGALESDDLSMTNVSGADLSNCTLLVTLATDSEAAGEQKRQHVHFVRRWPKDQTLFGVYHNAISGRLAKDESLVQVKRVSVQVYSDQFQGTHHYSYWNSADRKADLKQYCESNIEFRAKYVPETDGLVGKGDGLYRSDAGVRLWLYPAGDEVSARLTPGEIQVVLRKGNESVDVAWEGSEWQGGGVAPFRTFLSPKFNAMGQPDRFGVRLRFPGTDYEHVLEFRP